MKIRTLALTLAVALGGTAFAATTTTITKETPNGTVTRQVVKHHDRHMHNRHVAVYREPTHRHHKGYHTAAMHHRHAVVVHRS
jgi:hypothetical protein